MTRALKKRSRKFLKKFPYNQSKKFHDSLFLFLVKKQKKFFTAFASNESVEGIAQKKSLPLLTFQANAKRDSAHLVCVNAMMKREGCY